MDAGFLSVVEIGQYFMTKDTGEQFYAMAVANTLFQEKKKKHHNKRMDPREHQNWTRAGSYDQLLVWQTWS